MKIYSLFNPLSNQHHALKDFKKLALTQQITTIALTALASIATAFIATCAVFRLLVGHFTQMHNKKNLRNPEAHAAEESNSPTPHQPANNFLQTQTTQILKIDSTTPNKDKNINPQPIINLNNNLAEEITEINSKKHNYTTEQIHQWLFEGKGKPAPNFPHSKLPAKQNHMRNQNDYAPKTTFSSLRMITERGTYTNRIAIYAGGVTDLKAEQGQNVALGDSNNGDLLTGCGFAIATAVINAAGANLQRDLYNRFGVPGVMRVPEGAVEYTQKTYGGSEGRGYAITCDAHDMKATHHISRIEFMTVPMNDENGVRNMYKEAFEHSKDLDYIVMPMAGMSHPVLENKPKLSAEIATSEFQKFVDRHPDSNLKVVYVIHEPIPIML